MKAASDFDLIDGHWDLKIVGGKAAQGCAASPSQMVVLGLLLGLVGTDVNTGARRFNFDMMR